MPERKTTVLVPPNNTPMEGWDVPISESSERWSEVRLEDGSVLRVKPLVTAVVRVPGEFDPEGNPLYVVRGALMMVPVDVPEKLKSPKKP